MPTKLFKPGAEWTGNANGRPKGSLSLTTLLRQELEKVSAEDKQGRTYATLLIKKLLVSKALNEGDTSAIREILDRIDGKVKEHHQVELEEKVKADIDMEELAIEMVKKLKKSDE